LGGIYKGLTTTILKQGTNQAIRFYVYGEVSNYLSPNKDLSIVHSLIAGAVAGGASVMG